ncbi:C4-dicarboxylate TRAP transporter substrate-binding protein [Piscinibacter sakaiensis]|uniref:C4-dicarboxylate TRAP transporter substrate-binding protein n=1 Tax=Piscinibacter sakaiensis TaxID=1547922 RepID=UPI003AAD12AE
MKLSKLLLALGLGVAIASGPAAARDLKLASGVLPTHTNHTGYEAFAKALKEQAPDMNVRILPLSFLNSTQTYAGIRDGVVDLGFVLAPLLPSDLPEAQLPINLAMLGSSGFAMAGAMTEYLMTCQECQAEKLKMNHVYLGSVAAGPYWILSTKKITTLDDIKGKKLRSGAAPWGRWASDMGAVAMSITPNEIFEAMSQGTLDGGMLPASELTNLRLIDLVKHVTTGAPGGTYHGMEILNVNRNTWRALSEPQRRAVVDAAAMGSAVVTLRFLGDVERNLAEARKKGIQIHEAAPDLVARSKAFAAADIARVAASAEKDYGIKNAPAKAQRFRDLVAKWEKLIPPGIDKAEPKVLADILHKEIYSKIDVKTYGM